MAFSFHLFDVTLVCPLDAFPVFSVSCITQKYGDFFFLVCTAYVNNYELAFKTKKYSVDFYVRRTTEAINGIYTLDGQISYYQKFNEGIQQQIGLSYNRYGNLTKWWYVNAVARVFNENSSMNWVQIVLTESRPDLGLPIILSYLKP